MEQKLKVTNDLVFQQIFGKIGNERITKGLLEKILGIEIEELTLDTNKRLIGKIIDNKVGRVDVKARLSNGTKVIIEMQVITHRYMTERILYYWAQTYTNDLKRGENYEKLNKTIVVLVSVENLQETKEIEKYHTKWKIKEEENYKQILTEDLEIHIIELSKFKEGTDRPEDNWIKFIKGAKMEKVEKIEKEIEEAMKELEVLGADPEMRELYELKEKEIRDKEIYLISGKEEGREEGLREGKEEGVRKTREEIVLNMHKKNMKIDDICEVTNLAKEKVLEIINA